MPLQADSAAKLISMYAVCSNIELSNTDVLQLDSYQWCMHVQPASYDILMTGVHTHTHTWDDTETNWNVNLWSHCMFTHSCCSPLPSRKFITALSIIQSLCKLTFRRRGTGPASCGAIHCRSYRRVWGALWSVACNKAHLGELPSLDIQTHEACYLICTFREGCLYIEHAHSLTHPLTHSYPPTPSPIHSLIHSPTLFIHSLSRLGNSPRWALLQATLHKAPQTRRYDSGFGRDAGPVPLLLNVSLRLNLSSEILWIIERASYDCV